MCAAAVTKSVEEALVTHLIHKQSAIAFPYHVCDLVHLAQTAIAIVVNQLSSNGLSIPLAILGSDVDAPMLPSDEPTPLIFATVAVAHHR